MGSTSSSEVDESQQDKNLRFYRNEIKSKPWPGHKIEDMLRWFGKYDKLENNHDFIQWLFPIKEYSNFNSYAQPLREHEAKAITDDALAQGRVLEAYTMMLDFYGMRLLDDVTGQLARQKNWHQRYKHLNRSTHNYRRITRIIQSLGELGYERFQVPLVTFLMEESIVHLELPNLQGGCMRHWIEAIKDDSERKQIYKNYHELTRKCRPDDNISHSVPGKESSVDLSNGNIENKVPDTNALNSQGSTGTCLEDSHSQEK